MKIKGKAVRAKKSKGQRVKNELKALGLIDEGRMVGSDEDYVYVPVLERVPDKYEVVEKELETREKRKGFRELLVERFGEKGAKGVLSSYDVVGDIAIVQVPEGLRAHEAEVGELLLRGEKKVNAVWKKAGGREGEFRVTKLMHLAGEERSETEYVENGVRMKLDVRKVYFSPRLSHERKRVLGEVKEGENVLVLFAGVGPFALEIGKACPHAKVVGVELNPEAIKYFEENIVLNKLGNVEAVLGDAQKAAEGEFSGWADRIAMPLPMGAEEFLGAAFSAAKPGCIVHFYRMVDRKGGVEVLKERIRKAAEKAGREVEFIFEKEVRPYSAATMQIVIDFRTRQSDNP
ncbi:methyltransferase domain-containing protein [Candidatus Micrarchaeota archaeon]|nr:methyltransferase domain-containing protein [Candidatus Micrarchaeota archaeon]MBD3418209.1 methyltransferase domain-containing protein [Candidatus Micrarchaeota archaeon]